MNVLFDLACDIARVVLFEVILEDILEDYE